MINKNQRFPFLLLLFGVSFFSLTPVFAAPGLLGDGGGMNSHPHNLSNRSTAAIHSSEEDRICIFCHAPHGTSSSGPLWNRKDPTGPFPLYAGTEALSDNPGLTGYTAADQSAYPNGSTRLCLSCHDGVTAIAEVINGGSLDPTGLGTDNLTDLIGTSEWGAAAIIDLSRAHPVSFIFNESVLALYPGSYSNVPTMKPNLNDMIPGLLDSQNRLQCAGCHDPHTDTYVSGVYELPMWRNYDKEDENLDYKAVCESCHNNAPMNIKHN